MPATEPNTSITHTAVHYHWHLMDQSSPFLLGGIYLQSVARKHPTLPRRRLVGSTVLCSQHRNDQPSPEYLCAVYGQEVLECCLHAAERQSASQ